MLGEILIHVAENGGCKRSFVIDFVVRVFEWSSVPLSYFHKSEDISAKKQDMHVEESIILNNLFSYCHNQHHLSSYRDCCVCTGLFVYCWLIWETNTEVQTKPPPQVEP